MKIGVVIATIGRKSLLDCIGGLIGQPYDQLHVTRDFRGNVGRARNIGWKALASTCDVIAIIDDDCVPDKDWIETGRDFFEKNQKCAVMQGRVYGGLETHKKLMFITANLWVRSTSLLQVGGFDDGYIYAGAEDLDLGWSILEAGGQCLFNDKCRVNHPTKEQHKFCAFNTKKLATKFPERYARVYIKGASD